MALDHLFPALTRKKPFSMKSVDEESSLTAVYVDGAIYYMDYDDVQVAIVEAGRARTTNVDSASGPGADLAVRFNLTKI